MNLALVLLLWVLATAQTTKTDIVQISICEYSRSGVLAYKSSCQKYISCKTGSPIILMCPKNQFFDVQTLSCRAQEDANCNTDYELLPISQDLKNHDFSTKTEIESNMGYRILGLNTNTSSIAAPLTQLGTDTKDVINNTGNSTSNQKPTNLSTALEIVTKATNIIRTIFTSTPTFPTIPSKINLTIITESSNSNPITTSEPASTTLTTTAKPSNIDSITTTKLATTTQTITTTTTQATTNTEPITTTEPIPTTSDPIPTTTTQTVTNTESSPTTTTQATTTEPITTTTTQTTTTTEPIPTTTTQTTTTTIKIFPTTTTQITTTKLPTPPYPSCYYDPYRPYWYLPDPQYRQYFYMCYYGILYHYSCPCGQIYYPYYQRCMYAYGYGNWRYGCQYG